MCKASLTTPGQAQAVQEPWLCTAYPTPYGAFTQEPLLKDDLDDCEVSHHPSPKDVLMECESKGCQRTQSSLLRVGCPLLIQSTL